MWWLKAPQECQNFNQDQRFSIFMRPNYKTSVFPVAVEKPLEEHVDNHETLICYFSTETQMNEGFSMLSAS